MDAEDFRSALDELDGVNVEAVAELECGCIVRCMSNGRLDTIWSKKCHACRVYEFADCADCHAKEARP